MSHTLDTLDTLAHGSGLRIPQWLLQELLSGEGEGGRVSAATVCTATSD